MRTFSNHNAKHPSPWGRAWVGLLLLLLPLLLFAACSSDEVEAPAIAKDVTITLGAAGGRTTRADADPNALDHELIHTLHVFLVNSSGTVVKDYHFSAADLGGGADQGNLPEKTISSIADVNAGSGYTIYAFANFDDYYATDNTTQDIDARIRACSTQSALNAICNLVVNDPAGKLNFAEGRYIPMAVKQTGITIADGVSIRVEMIRLVSRIDLSVINNRKSDVTLSTFEIGTFPSAVTVLADATTTLPTNTTTVSIAPAVTIPAATTTAQSVATLYVNATESSSHSAFNLTATLAGETASYSGTTTRTTLPRNSIFPLTLNFSEFEVNFEITPQIAPIGGYPINVLQTNAATEDLLISLPEGCTFTVAPTLQRHSGTAILTDDGATFLWEAPVTLPSWFQLTATLPTTAVSAASAKLTGKVSAEAGLTFTDGQYYTLTTTARNGKTYTNRLRFTTVAIDNTTK